MSCDRKYLFAGLLQPTDTQDNSNNNKQFFVEKMKCDVRLMIDCDVVEENNENKVGMS